ncbi:MAG TPA: HAD-IIB family hydrolase [Candidatus Saccharimonadales bacterium]|nr:HAD-IIB family hydrolase [Candidatus Saccharimonadales bacterium]
MNYKSLIFDLDFTAIPSVIDGMPNQAVIEAVKKAKDVIKVSTASGRSVQNCRNVWKAMDITDPCIISGGSQIMNPKTEEILWEEKLPDGAIQSVAEISRKHGLTMAINGEIFAPDTRLPETATIIVIMSAKNEIFEDLVSAYSKLPSIAIYILPSWISTGMKDIHITHKLATKKHAVEKLLQILGVKKEEAIGVGDGNNDMPLFESVGYKVAMGNAQEVLKKSADYITDTFDNNGLAKFIEENLIK